MPRAAPVGGKKSGGVVKRPPARRVEDYPKWSTLTDIQKDAVRAANERKSVIVCGAAGTGKSYLIRALHWLGAAITATTGTAAALLTDGSTIHHRMGWRVGDTVDSWKNRGEHKKFAGKLQTYGGRFVIDEVSMLGDTTATQISEMFRAAIDVIPKRVCDDLGLNAARPFGGCAMIFCGDMMQLLPVGNELQMFYHSPAVQEIFWPESGLPTGVCVMLVQIFRQTSSLYRHLVECVRYAHITPMAWLIAAIIVQRAALLKSSNATQLFPTNAEVDRVNKQQLALFKDHFTTEFAWRMDKLRGRPLVPHDRLSDTSDRIVERIMYHDNKDPNPRKPLVLAVGARVIFTHNLSEGEEGPAVTNGEHGRIISVEDPNDEPIITVLLDNGGERTVQETKLAERKLLLLTGSVIVDELLGYPLTLGWAKTIHRAQGVGLSALIADLSASYHGLQLGALYTTLSRCGAMGHIAPRGLLNAMLKHKWSKQLQHFCTRMKFDAAVERTRLKKESVEMMPDISNLLFSIERIVAAPHDIINHAVWLRRELINLHGPGFEVEADILRECHL